MIATEILGQGRAASYRYDHVTAQMFKEHAHFPDYALKAGDRMPRLPIFGINGSPLNADELPSHKPLLMVMGSLTCPMTTASMLDVRELHKAFGGEVDFVFLYIREAHPAEKITQPSTFVAKQINAEVLVRQYDIPFKTVIDGLHGALHQKLGGMPNGAFLFDSHGNVAFRTLWVGDTFGVRRALESMVAGTAPSGMQSERKLRPMIQGLGLMDDALEWAGKTALEDIKREVPVMAVLAKLASVFQPLRPLQRGIAAMATVGVTVAAVLVIAGGLVQEFNL